jgi:hypothetical protein
MIRIKKVAEVELHTTRTKPSFFKENKCLKIRRKMGLILSGTPTRN